MLEAFADLSTPLVADACLRCSVPLQAAPSGIRPVVAGLRGSLAGFCQCGTTAAWTCSWRYLAGHKPATCWSSTTAAARTRHASATWRCWRPRQPVCGPGGVGPAPRHAGTGRDRPSGLQLRELPCRAGAARQAGARGAGHRAVQGRIWSAPGTSSSPMTTACCSSRHSVPSRCWSQRTRSGRASGTRLPPDSGRARHCASRPLSMTTWPGAPLTRHTPSGGICAASAGPSKK